MKAILFVLGIFLLLSGVGYIVVSMADSSYTPVNSVDYLKDMNILKWCGVGALIIGGIVLYFVVRIPGWWKEVKKEFVS